MRPIDADRLLDEKRKTKYYHLPNGDIAIPIIDIEHAPTIEPKQSEWIRHKNPRYEYDRENGETMAGVSYSCSLCGKVHLPTPFCPNCGCRMKGADDE